ncbi:MAG: TetR/AcrR family transcriptional regulator [Terracidiphilus sp.]
MPKISEEKRQARQAQILNAATRCFARDGFHRTSMEDIVRESGLSPGAIYCYFRGKHDMVEAISAERHARDQALLADLISSPSLSEGMDQVAHALSQMLQDPKERQRRKVSIQFWAESLHDARIRKVADRGMRQRDRLTAALKNAQKKGEIPGSLDADSVSRVMFALLQGFILQQAWEPGLDIPAYVTTAMALLRSAFSQPGHNPSRRYRKTTLMAAPQVS